VLKRTVWSGLAVATLGATSAWGAAPPDRQHQVLSKVYHVDKKYRSMMGPSSTDRFTLGDANKDELVWITGYEAVMVGADGKSPMPQEFMCHSNLDLDPLAHREKVTSEPGISGRLFTLSQGQFTIRFPPGFGIPVKASEPIALTTQVLNLNHDPADYKVRHKVTVHYATDAAVKQGMKPLFQKSAYGLALLEGKDGHFGMQHGEGHKMDGTGCMEGKNASDHTYDDGVGRKFTGHWVVPPGREVNRTPVTRILALPYDTTVHYIAVHLHPLARSLELIDKTTGFTVFKSTAKNAVGKLGLEHVEAFSSPEGLPMYKDHEYELVSIYENDTGEPQDSMAVMYLYLLDKRFERP
jgi:hypothetical protein